MKVLTDKTKWKIPCFLIFTVICSVVVGDGSIVSAKEGNSAFSGCTYWTEDTISAEVESIGSDYKIIMSTSDMKEEYGYLSVIGGFSGNTASGAYNSEGMAGLQMECSVDTEKPFFMNAALEDRNGNKIFLKESARIAVIKGEESSIMELEKGGLAIEPDFTGKLILPFDAFENSEQHRFDELLTCGLNLLLSSGTEAILEIGNVKWLPAGDPVLDFTQSMGIEGVSELEIPVQGEAITDFTLKTSNGEAFSFSPLEPLPGITMDEGGHMVLTSEAEAGKITLYAHGPRGMTLVKKVQIKEPLRFTADFLPEFPGVDQLSPIHVPLEKMGDVEIIGAVRAVLLFVSTVLLITYVLFRRRASRSNKEEIKNAVHE